MKKLLLYALIFGMIALFSACDEESDPVEPADTTGELFLSSVPAGAEIWVEGVNTGLATPDTVMDVDEGIVNYTLKLANYEDYSASVSVTGGQISVVSDIALTPIIVEFGPVKLWETTGTTAQQPSGLDLSTGDAFGISDTDNNGTIDIYYYSSSDGTTYLVQSADISSRMDRVTKFLVTTASDLNDGEDAPAVDGTWTDSMNDEETNYVFLYDADGNFSKLKIVAMGGGTPGDPSWIEVTYKYNTATGSQVF